MTTSKPIFVVGSPRSGTTLLGRLVASIPSILDLGEYGAFLLGHYYFPHHFFRRSDGLFRAEYTSRLKDLAETFAYDACKNANSSFFLDSTPSNAIICKELLERLPNSIFIIVLRNPIGVIQSLKNSFDAGFTWAGESTSARCRLWNAHYAPLLRLPARAVVQIDYDQLCQQPTEVVARFRGNLCEHEIDSSSIDLSVFAKSHATTNGNVRPTIGTNSNGVVELQPIQSFDSSPRARQQFALIRKLTASVYDAMQNRF